MGGGARYRVIFHNGQGKPELRKIEPPFSKAKKPEPEEKQKLKRVLIIESDPHMLMLIEDQLKNICEIVGYRCAKGRDAAVSMVTRDMDIAVIGPMFSGPADGIASDIRKVHPDIKVVKIAGTSEYKRITSEFQCIGPETRTYDAVVQFNRIGELKEIVGSLA